MWMMTRLVASADLAELHPPFSVFYTGGRRLGEGRRNQIKMDKVSGAYVLGSEAYF